jgi:hypothetical protein
VPEPANPADFKTPFALLGNNLVIDDLRNLGEVHWKIGLQRKKNPDT